MHINACMYVVYAHKRMTIEKKYLRSTYNCTYAQQFMLLIYYTYSTSSTCVCCVQSADLHNFKGVLCNF